jgi:hypothetical protein
MSAYKKLNKQDAFITTYTAHKTWAVPSGNYSDYGITQFIATGEYSSSIQQLYYPSKSLGNVTSHPFDYYNQTTLYFSQSRNFTNNARIFSIPRDLYGVNIHPDKSLQLQLRTIVGDELTLNVALDDGEGNLYISGSNPTEYIGDVIYSHGILCITHDLYKTSLIRNVVFKSSHPILTHNYHCKIRESELNYTYNPSALSGSLKTVYDNDGNIYSTSASISDGVIRSNVTGSEFQPYITTVGLYNDANELIAVGKLNRPVPKSQNTEMTIIVKIDI